MADPPQPEPKVVIKYLPTTEAKRVAEDLKDAVARYNDLLAEAKRIGLYVSLEADRKHSLYDNYRYGYVGNDKIKITITGSFSL